MKRKVRKAIMQWIENEVDRLERCDLISIDIGMSRPGGPCVWYPDDPARRYETQSTVTTSIHRSFRA